MAKKIKCQGHECEDKAQLFVAAFGQKPFDGYFCDKCAGRIIRLRGKLLRKYGLNCVVRPIRELDHKLFKARKKAYK